MEQSVAPNKPAQWPQACLWACRTAPKQPSGGSENPLDWPCCHLRLTRGAHVWTEPEGHSKGFGNWTDTRMTTHRRQHRTCSLNLTKETACLKIHKSQQSPEDYLTDPKWTQNNKLSRIQPKITWHIPTSPPAPPKTTTTGKCDPFSKEKTTHR